MEKIIEIKDLRVNFFVRNKELKIIRGIDLDIYKGRTIGIVGESGSGKSVLTKTLTGMIDDNGYIPEGTILYSGNDLAKFGYLEGFRNDFPKDHEKWREIRGKKIATIFQDPMTSLNPLRRVGSQLMQVLREVRGLSKEEAKEEALSLLEKVGIPNASNRFRDYPFQYSGGMRQRVVIAIALACRPEILICDEPTTALDVTVQAQILDLINELKKEYGLTVIFITHDLGVVSRIADDLAVMYAGQIVEKGEVNEVFYNAQHPYTWALLSSLPQLGEKDEELFSISGTPPSSSHEIIGDAFAPRNKFALKIDFEKEPPMFKVGDSATHYAKTWLLDERSPEVVKPEIINTLYDKVDALINGRNK